jgi:hypothetical protein
METEDIKMAINLLEESIDSSFANKHKIDMKEIKKLSDKIIQHNKSKDESTSETTSEIVDDSITVSHVEPNSDMFRVKK